MTIRQITEYLFFDEEIKQLQVDIPKLLSKLGLPDTQTMRDQATKVVCELMRKEYPAQGQQDDHTASRRNDSRADAAEVSAL